MIKRISIIILLLSTFCINSFSQIEIENEFNNDSTYINKLNFQKVPKLEVIIELALKNSPLLNASDIEIKKILEQIKIEKRSLLDNIHLEGNVRYGLNNVITISDLTSGNQSDFATQSANEQFNYYGGLSLKLPLSEFGNSRNRIRIEKLNVEDAKYRKENIKNEITRIVIEEYYKLMGFEESLESSQEFLQTMKIAYLRALKEVENGTIDMSEFSMIISNKDKAQQGYAQLKNEYFSQLFKLKILMGENTNMFKNEYNYFY